MSIAERVRAQIAEQLGVKLEQVAPAASRDAAQAGESSD